MRALCAVLAWLLLGTAGWAESYQNAVVQAVVPGGSVGMYASTCSVTVNGQTATSVFCPVGTDADSPVKRTYPAGSLTKGKAFRLEGGGTYTVPTGNLLRADIAIRVGSATAMSITTPAAPVGTNEGVDFHATCTVRSATTIACQGTFAFVVAGATPVIQPFSQVSTFDPSVANLIDVLGDWNGTTTSHATTVTQAVLVALN